jgi:hypothetical protein
MKLAKLAKLKLQKSGKEATLLTQIDLKSKKVVSGTVSAKKKHPEALIKDNSVNLGKRSAD